MTERCAHLTAAATQDPTPGSESDCQDCSALGERNWAHLRICTECGHVGCCDSSPHRHASAHHHVSGHPVIRSFEPGEGWLWCFEHEVLSPGA